MEMAERLALSEGTFEGCFGCGPANEVGLRLSFERRDDAVVSRVTLDRSYAGYREFVHGGIVATMLDEAMGWALYHIAGTYGVTRSLSVRYRRPVAVGRPLLLRASVEAANGRSVRLTASIEDERGRLLASGEGDWAVVRDARASSD